MTSATLALMLSRIAKEYSSGTDPAEALQLIKAMFERQGMADRTMNGDNLNYTCKRQK